MAVEIKLGGKEKRLLGMVVVVFLFAFVGPGFLGDYALQYRNNQEALRVNYENQIQEIEGDLGSIEERKEILRRYINRYRRLVEQDVLSLPEPVNLVQQMKEITTQRKQNATAFQFGDNILLPPEDSTYTVDSSVGVNIYPLDIQMGMLHDMDIFMFMESLEDRVANIGFPVKCSIDIESSDFVVLDRENFQGACRISWYAVTDPNRSNSNAQEGADAPETVQG